MVQECDSKITNKLLGLEKINLNNPVPTKHCTQAQPNSLSMRCVCSQTRGRHIAGVESSSVSVHFVTLALLMRFQGPVKTDGTRVYISYLGASKQVLQAITQQHFLTEKQLTSKTNTCRLIYSLNGQLLSYL